MEQSFTKCGICPLVEKWLFTVSPKARSMCTILYHTGSRTLCHNLCNTIHTVLILDIHYSLSYLIGFYELVLLVYSCQLLNLLHCVGLQVVYNMMNSGYESAAPAGHEDRTSLSLQSDNEAALSEIAKQKKIVEFITYTADGVHTAITQKVYIRKSTNM